MRRKGTVSEPDTNISNQTGPVNAWTPERIIKLRAGLDLSQEDFAKMVKRSRQQVSGWENGKVAVTARVAATLTALEAQAAANAAPIAPPEVQGSSLLAKATEVEALMAYALERQRLFVAAMGEQYGVSIGGKTTPQR